MNRLPPKCKCVFTHFSRRKQTKTQRFIPMWDIDRQNEQDKLMKIKIFTVNLNFKELETKRLTKWKCEYLQSLGGKTYVKKKKKIKTKNGSDKQHQISPACVSWCSLASSVSCAVSS